MPSIGKNEAPAAEPLKDPLTFDLAGETFTLRPVPAPVVFLEFAKAAADGVTDDSAEGKSVTLRCFEGMLEPAEYARFLQHLRRTAIGEGVLIEIIGDVFTYLAERPTQSLSDSPASPGSDATSSAGDSSVTESLPHRRVSLAVPIAS